MEENKEKIANIFSFVFLVAFGLGCGYWISEKSDMFNTFLDFERKDYKPFMYGDNLLLINSKNGKTYLFEKEETQSFVNYHYVFLAQPKTNKTKIIKKRSNEEVRNKLKNANYSDEDINKYLDERDPLNLFVDKTEIEKEMKRRGITKNGIEYEVVE